MYFLDLSPRRQGSFPQFLHLLRRHILYIAKEPSCPVVINLVVFNLRVSKL